jgi:dihydroxyacid dehydratase/phosphogluconate dehydratase
VPRRALNVELSDEELDRRRSEGRPPTPVPQRGYAKLFVDHVLQADRGVDFDFLVGSSGHGVPRESH